MDKGPATKADSEADSAADSAADRTTPYARIGGAAGVAAFVERFYGLMDTLPEAAACRAIHPPSLAGSAEKLTWYLTGWLGGPPLFVERRGAPMLRRRHFVAAIGAEERDGWLLCFHRAWAETVADPDLTALIVPQVESLAQHMVNRE
ncbi:group II truncated hemoglobin [Prosthecomicrobium hirschii]|uniref:group II truncated hemoglobin n=1 Tax=Prosthecodimorpha hirschii TaxID=665126 RepID=UPI00221F9A96|nr:group II truncated hemoglobin [Prosthecomicrobium hirschii]MCW1838578.1 group II truncated hemoglobin [Prosthecomicrobium hirschii]